MTGAVLPGSIRDGFRWPAYERTRLGSTSGSTRQAECSVDQGNQGNGLLRIFTPAGYIAKNDDCLTKNADIVIRNPDTVLSVP
jgi:hypothetical protein